MFSYFLINLFRDDITYRRVILIPGTTGKRTELAGVALLQLTVPFYHWVINARLLWFTDVLFLIS